MAFKNQRLTTTRKDQIERLAVVGLFSAAYIAEKVFGTAQDDESEAAMSDRECVRSYLRRNKISLRAGRDGKTLASQWRSRQLLSECKAKWQAMRKRFKLAATK